MKITTSIDTAFMLLNIYMYIYIYICVCVLSVVGAMITMLHDQVFQLAEEETCRPTHISKSFPIVVSLSQRILRPYVVQFRDAILGTTNMA